MFATFLESYVLFFAVFLPATVLTIVAVNAVRAGLTQRQVVLATTMTAFIFGGWYALASWAGLKDLLMPPPTVMDPPIVLMFLFGGAFLLWALARLTTLGRAISDQASQAYLIGFQIPRVMGFVFLLGWALGAIPWQFAIPAGIGDIWAGIAGYQAMKAVSRGDADAEAKVLRANLIGMGDFVVAVVTGLITSEGFLHLLSQDAPNIINHYPLALFPAFFVPIFLAFHFISLSKLRQTRRLPVPA